MLAVFAILGSTLAANIANVITVDFAVLGNDANGRAAGVLNAFCNDSVQHLWPHYSHCPAS